jgi:hypothetical protein
MRIRARNMVWFPRFPRNFFSRKSSFLARRKFEKSIIKIAHSRYQENALKWLEHTLIIQVGHAITNIWCTQLDGDYLNQY